MTHTVHMPSARNATRRDRVEARLTAAGCVAAHEEAAELCAAAPDDETLDRWVGEREHGRPLAWILGATTFCGHRLHVDHGVYVPRAQSEELARRAAGRLPRGGAAADLCTGSGALAAHLHAEVPDATVVAVDADPAAAACARSNGVPVVIGDLGACLRPLAFDLVTAVAPYVPTGHLHLLPADVQRYEPARALDGGDDGLRLVREVVDAAACVLRPGGWLLVELGGEQDVALRSALDAHGFAAVATWTDEDGDLRGLEARLVGRRFPST